MLQGSLKKRPVFYDSVSPSNVDPRGDRAYAEFSRTPWFPWEKAINNAAVAGLCVGSRMLPLKGYSKRNRTAMFLEGQLGIKSADPRVRRWR